MPTEPQAKVRCFVAIDTPDNLKEQVSNLIARLRNSEGGRKVKWVRPDGVHLTLKFLGDVAAEQVPEINSALASALSSLGDNANFELSLGGLGTFGKANAPRVIWVGVGGNRPALNKLQQVVEGVLNPLGFPPENHDFNPHLTLGRVPEYLGREELAGLNCLISRYTNSPEVEFGSFPVTEAVLMESDRQPTGAVYTPIFHYPLK